MYDGAGLGLPLRVREPPQHFGYQACRGLAHLQSGLPLLYNTFQRFTTGENSQHFHY